MLEALTLNHLALPARHPEALRDWYIKVLKFQARGKQLHSDGCVLTILEGNPLPQEDFHFGFRLSDSQSLQNWKTQLSQHGIQPTTEYHHENYQSFFVRDPEGNDLEFFVESLLTSRNDHQ